MTDDDLDYWTAIFSFFVLGILIGVVAYGLFWA